MGLTITEKILRDHTAEKNAVAGDFILTNVDKCLLTMFDKTRFGLLLSNIATAEELIRQIRSFDPHT